MTENEAYGLIGALAGATNGWSEDAVNTYVAEVVTWDDIAAAQLAIADLCRSWTDSFKPTLGQVIESYRAQRKRIAEATALPPGPLEVAAPKRGIEIAREAYRSAYGRYPDEEPAPDPQRAMQLIREQGRVFNGFYLATYTDVLRGMRGDHRRARSSLLAVGPALAWDNRGNLGLPVVLGEPARAAGLEDLGPISAISADLGAGQARGPVRDQRGIQETAEEAGMVDFGQAARDLGRRLEEDF